MRPLTDRIPKPLVPVLGIPVAQYSLDVLRDFGVSEVVANVHHLADDCEFQLRRLASDFREVRVSDERKLLLGSAGGIRTAAEQIRGDRFFTLNADVICDADLRALEARHRRLHQQWGIALTLLLLPAPVGGLYRALELDATGARIVGTSSRLAEKGEPYFSGTAVFERNALLSLSPHEVLEFLPAILLPQIAQGKVGAAFQGDSMWMDVGSPQLWAEAHFGLMDRLERAALRRSWQRRVEAANVRVGEGRWLARCARRLGMGSFSWEGPGYWSPLASGAEIPLHLGAGSIGYGTGDLDAGALGYGDWNFQLAASGK